MQAIERLGMGVMDKLWLEFPDPFWEKDHQSDWIEFLNDQVGYWTFTLNAFKYLQVPLLCMFNVGGAA